MTSLVRFVALSRKSGAPPAQKMLLTSWWLELCSAQFSGHVQIQPSSYAAYGFNVAKKLWISRIVLGYRTIQEG